MRKLLLIEPDQTLRQSTAEILTQSGYQVVTAAHGAEGLRQFQTQPFDVVVTEIVMPEKDGLEVIMGILREKPEVCVVAMSVRVFPGLPLDVLRIAKNLGACATLWKPHTRAELLEALTKCGRLP